MTTVAGPGVAAAHSEVHHPSQGLPGMLQVCGGSSAERFSRDTSKSNPWPGQKLITMQSQKASSFLQIVVYSGDGLSVAELLQNAVSKFNITVTDSLRVSDLDAKQ